MADSTWNQMRNKEANKLLGELVCRLAKLDVGSQRYTEVYESVTACRKFHSYMSVDPGKVNASIDGVVDKLFVHGLGERSRCLRNLVDSFLHSYSLRSATQTSVLESEVPHAVLSFLLRLSGQPTVPTFPDYPLTRNLDVPSESDDIDWGRYLLDGEDWYAGSSSSESSDSDEFTDDRMETIPQRAQIFPVEDPNEVTIETESKQDVSSLYSELDKVNKELDGLIIRPYWKDIGCYSNRESVVPWLLPVGSPVENLVTETQIVSETLWLLQGQASLCCYATSDSGDHVVPTPGLVVSHLTRESLADRLGYFAGYGTALQRIGVFVNQSLTGECSRTYQAFAAAVSGVLRRNKREIHKVEELICIEGNKPTLLSLKESLADCLDRLDLLQRIYIEGIANNTLSDNVCRSNNLLRVLHSHLVVEDSLGRRHSRQYLLLLSLLVATLRPYLEILDGWVSDGRLVDRHREFPVARRPEVGCKSPGFWDRGYQVYARTSGGRKERAEGGLLVPEFLLPVVDNMLIAGKSSELFNVVWLEGSGGEARGAVGRGLHGKFVTSLREVLGLTSLLEELEVASLPEEPLGGVEGRTEGDRLMEIHFALLSNPGTTHLIRDDVIDVGLCDVTKYNHYTASQVFRHCLYPHVWSLYDASSRRLLSALSDSYALSDHLRFVHSIYFLSDGLSDFLTDLFDKLLRDRQGWRDVAYLNGLLSDCLSERHCRRMVDLTYVSVEEQLDTDEELAAMKIHYLPPWPVSLLINAETESKYQVIFTEILQLKLAKYSLESLSFGDLVVSRRGIRGNVVHRVLVLRVRLLHFINSYHSYLLSRIYYGECSRLLGDMEAVSDVDQLLGLHWECLRVVGEFALLPKAVEPVHRAILKLERLAMSLARRWRMGPSAFTYDLMSQLEDRFDKLYEFLCLFLSRAVRKGSLPHLEGLAVLLTTDR